MRKINLFRSNFTCNLLSCTYTYIQAKSFLSHMRMRDNNESFSESKIGQNTTYLSLRWKSSVLYYTEIRRSLVTNCIDSPAIFVTRQRVNFYMKFELFRLKHCTSTDIKLPTEMQLWKFNGSRLHFGFYICTKKQYQLEI